MICRLTAAVSFIILLNTAHAAPPPELTALQQQYAFAVAERVTSPYDTGAAALNEKFLAALTNAAAEAKKAGKLPEILAIDEDKKLIAAKLPLPEADDEKTPESLKKLRGIYRAASAKLMEQRQAAHAALLPAYTARLQALESTLTKGDRMEEAKEVLKYRETVGSDLQQPAVAAATATPPPAAAKKNEGKTPKVKGDDRKAAEWVLSLGNRHRLVVDDNKTIKSLPDLPKGRLSIKIIEIDGRFLDAPVNGETIKVLAGLQELNKLRVSHVPLNDVDFSFLPSLPALDSLVIENTGSTDTVVSQVLGCKTLRHLELSQLDGFAGSTLGQLVVLPRLTELRCWKTKLNEAGMTQIAQLQRLVQLQVNGQRSVTNAIIPHLQALKSLTSLFIDGTAMTVEGVKALKLPNLTSFAFNMLDGRPLRETAPVLAPAFPKVATLEISYDVETAEDLAALTAFPKFDNLHSYGNISVEAMSGLAACTKLVTFDSPSAQKFTDEHLRGLAASKSVERILMANSEITDSGLMLVVPMKKLNYVMIKSPALSDAGVAAFKKERPDVKIER